ncbi:probable serine/threonine-protein kinase DDB_G0277449 [Galendromus occidentalis]|uniref:Serine/threonine-protein kinase greatwall n=1 Tax=Galendromus occidentalis TaxID=34638 RepID=A0AAJ7L5C2_9ACAR|nr:probable serine/threonine-protein kinase DDB_G0277449 [Galendromus occidentalis]
MKAFKKNAGIYLRKGREKFTNLLSARNAESNIFYDLRNHRELDMARKVLDAFVKENQTSDTTISPAQRFVKDQAVGFAKYVLQEIVNEHLTANILREGIENLYFLGHYWKCTEEIVAKCLGSDLCYIVDGLGPLIEIAEQLSRLPSTDWIAVCLSIRAELIAPCGEVVEQACIPSIKYFYFERLLGAGGFGAVYKAFVGEAVCSVKIVPKSMLPDIEHAVADKEVATMVNHPCLVHYHATFATAEAFVTVMEYIRGVDVIRLVHLSTRLSETLVRLILAQLGLALYHLHYKGFVHRDVKPANMMIMVGCRVKLIDFDTAKVCIGKYAKRTLTTFFDRTASEFNDGEIAGTIYYMAPEMLKSLDYGRAVDWWSFGVTAYVLSMGKLPFSLKPSMSFDEQKSILCKMSHSWPKGLQISKHFKSLVKQCLQKESSVRFCSRHYSDFPKHPFFCELDLRWVETSPEVLKFDPINSVALGTLTYDILPHNDSPCATPTAEKKCQTLFPTPGLTDTQEQVKLFTYLAPGFKRACQMIQRGELPTSEVIRITPELVDFHESGNTFFFTSFTDSKST